VARPIVNPDRFAVALKRLRRVLASHVVANDRIIEQKIADAGPTNQRIDPHILTTARATLVKSGEVIRVVRATTPWYHLAAADAQIVAERLAELDALHQQTLHRPFTLLVGQALEIAVYRALLAQQELRFFGAFRNLDDHDDSTLYTKLEPPSSVSGRDIGSRHLDFIVHTAGAVYGGIEVKNIRQWMYPARAEIREWLLKCCTLDIVPVLIARRIHFSTFSVLNPCGVVLHQTYNQLYPNSSSVLADQVRRKELLGYHDVQLGHLPDARLVRFIGTHLPNLLAQSRVKFDQFKDLLLAYGSEEHSYKSFAARVKRRTRGEPEDLPPFDPPDVDGFGGFDHE
jgi:hypothetical protein